MRKLVKEAIQKSEKNKNLLTDYIDAYQSIAWKEYVINQGDHNEYKLVMDELWTSLKQTEVKMVQIETEQGWVDEPKTVVVQRLGKDGKLYDEYKTIPEQFALLESALEGYTIEEIKQTAEAFRKEKANREAEKAAMRDSFIQADLNQSDNMDNERPEYANNKFYQLGLLEIRIKTLESDVSRLQDKADKSQNPGFILGLLNEKQTALTNARKEYETMREDSSDWLKQYQETSKTKAVKIAS